MRLPLVLGKKADRNASPAVSVEGLLNGYVSIVPQGKEPTPIFGTPGLTAIGNLGEGGVRGLLKVGAWLYVVCGSTLHRFSASGATETLGDIGPVLGGEDNVVSMTSDGTNVVVVNNRTIYVWNGTTVAAVTDPDAPTNAAAVEWVDGFFVFTDADSDDWAISALTDPTAYDALDFAAAEWKPDKLVAPLVYKRVLYLFGAETIEAQRNVGAQDFPFVRDDGVLFDCGLAGRHAKVATADSIYWLAHDLTARRLDGIAATIISTDAVNSAFADWPAPEATVVTSHVWRGHRFVVFRNPAGCWVYDQTTDLWHQRASYDMATWRVRCFADFNNQVICGDVLSGALYRLDKDAYDEAGVVLPFEMTTPYAYQQGRRFTINDVELIMQTGVGSYTTAPTISCSRTTDGLEWKLPKYRTFGLRGHRDTRVTFGAQGQSRGMAFRFRITDPVERVILGAYAEGEIDDQ